MKKLETRTMDLSVKRAACRVCGRQSTRHSQGVQHVRDVFVILKIRYSKHWCPNCKRTFSFSGKDHIVHRGARYAKRIMEHAVELRKQHHTLTEISDILRKRTGHRVPETTLHEWFSTALEIPAQQVRDKERSKEKNEHQKCAGTGVSKGPGSGVGGEENSSTGSADSRVQMQTGGFVRFVPLIRRKHSRGREKNQKQIGVVQDPGRDREIEQT